MVLARAWEKLKEGERQRPLDYFCSHTQGRAGQVSGGVRRFSTPGVTREYEGVRTKKEQDISSPVRQLALGWRFPNSASVSLAFSCHSNLCENSSHWDLSKPAHHENLCQVLSFSSLSPADCFSILLSVFRAWQSSQSKTLIHFLHIEALRLLNDDERLCRRDKSMYFNLNTFNFFWLDIQYNYLNILNQYIYF